MGSGTLSDMSVPISRKHTPEQCLQFQWVFWTYQSVCILVQIWFCEITKERVHIYGILSCRLFSTQYAAILEVAALLQSNNLHRSEI